MLFRVDKAEFVVCTGGGVYSASRAGRTVTAIKVCVYWWNYSSRSAVSALTIHLRAAGCWLQSTRKENTDRTIDTAASMLAWMFYFIIMPYQGRQLTSGSVGGSCKKRNGINRVSHHGEKIRIGFMMVHDVHSWLALELVGLQGFPTERDILGYRLLDLVSLVLPVNCKRARSKLLYNHQRGKIEC